MPDRVSKGFVLGCQAAALGSMFAGVLAAASQGSSAGGNANDLSILLFLLGAVAFALNLIVMIHKGWAVIQDGHARTTPGKAAGLLFVPLFNIYWMFQALPGLAKDYNAYLDRHSIEARRLPEGLFVAYPVLACTAWIPILGAIGSLIALVLIFAILARLCDAVNALCERQAPEVVSVGAHHAGLG